MEKGSGVRLFQAWTVLGGSWDLVTTYNWACNVTVLTTGVACMRQLGRLEVALSSQLQLVTKSREPPSMILSWLCAAIPLTLGLTLVEPYGPPSGCNLP